MWKIFLINKTQPKFSRKRSTNFKIKSRSTDGKAQCNTFARQRVIDDDNTLSHIYLYHPVIIVTFTARILQVSENGFKSI